MPIRELQKQLRQVADRDKAEILKRFFKTGPGQYGEGDKFLGVVVPDQRCVAKKFLDLPLQEVETLLHSPYHEERLTALLIMVELFKRGNENRQRKVYDLYLKNTKFINNWDLVDLTAPNIVGAYTYGRDRKVIYKLAKSRNLWERRIAILATFYYIRKGDIADTLKIAKMLLADDHDLIHKAVGWMLREIGNNTNQKQLTDFLDHYAHKMPRTMLRYSIEKLPEAKRKKYLAIRKEKICK